MKETGVVRRIDDLGRIVIPKEIRKTLRIKEGSPLEIFTEKDGDIILKKYSPIGELSNFSSEYASSISKVTNYITIITDKDCIIAVSGTAKKDLLEEPISEKLEEIINQREVFISFESEPTIENNNLNENFKSNTKTNNLKSTSNKNYKINLNESSKKILKDLSIKEKNVIADFSLIKNSNDEITQKLNGAKIIAPIISESETIGAIILIKPNSFSIQSQDIQTAKIAADFLGTHLEI